MSVSYDDFAKLDIRIAKIVSAKPIQGKTRILEGSIDIGSEQRSVIIGGAQYYTPDDLIGRTVVAIINLEPKNVAGVQSNAMLLAADDGNKPLWLGIDENAEPGTKIK